MIAQLELFQQQKAAPPIPAIDQLLGCIPGAVSRNSRYRPFDGAIAHSMILDRCRNADGWVGSRDINRAINMQPRDLARLKQNMVRRGELEENHLYYGSSKPGDKGYRGFQYGYRLARQ
jgi:hypothetical protein